MLPYDNKSELQVVLDMPEGTTLEATAAAARELAVLVKTRPEVADVRGLRRHVCPVQLQRPRPALLPEVRPARRGPAGEPRAQGRADEGQPHDRQGDPEPDRAGREAPRRERQGHRGARRGRRSSRRWSPRSTGRTRRAASRSRSEVRDIFESTPGVVDTDWLVEDASPKIELVVDREKAMRSGVTPEVVVKTLRIALERDGRGPPPRRRRPRGGAHRPAGSTAPSAPASRASSRRPSRRQTGRLVPIRELVTVVNGAREPVRLPQEPAAGDVRPRRDGGRRRGARLRHPRHEEAGSRRSRRRTGGPSRSSRRRSRPTRTATR